MLLRSLRTGKDDSRSPFVRSGAPFEASGAGLSAFTQRTRDDTCTMPKLAPRGSISSHTIPNETTHRRITCSRRRSMTSARRSVSIQTFHTCFSILTSRTLTASYSANTHLIIGHSNGWNTYSDGPVNFDGKISAILISNRARRNSTFSSRWKEFAAEKLRSSAEP